MNTFCRWSTRVYAALLPLYPPDLRRDFGADIVEAFAEDQEDAFRTRGFSGVFRVWWRAAGELLRIALPSQKENPAIVVPVILFAFCETLWSAQLMLVFWRRPESGIVLAGIPSMVAWPSLVAALTSLAAVWAGNRSLPNPLRFGSTSCLKSVI
ncbi:MAG: hypothetical protein ABUS49_04590 [Acidobacteriota bacterium]